MERGLPRTRIDRVWPSSPRKVLYQFTCFLLLTTVLGSDVFSLFAEHLGLNCSYLVSHTLSFSLSRLWISDSSSKNKNKNKWEKENS